MNKIIAAIDAGKNTTKSIGNTTSLDLKKNNFRTKLYDLANGDVDLEGNSYLITFDGKDYIIGDQGEEIDNSNTKTTLVHKLAIYTVISQLMGEYDIDTSVSIVIGCPANIFKNKTLKEEYRQYIKGNGKVQITVNSKDYSFTIDRVVIKCEGSGIVYVKPELFKNIKRAVIDLGGRNMNFAVYENMVPIPSTIFANELGSISLETELREQLQVYLGETVSLIDSSYALKNGGLIINGVLNEETALIVQQCKKNYIRKVLQEIKEKGINLSTMAVSAIGGTSITVQSELKDAIKHVDIITDNAQTICVEGFYKVAMVKFK